jgi:hypothetical protein
MHYYVLTKLPEPTDNDEEIKFWLALFKAETEEELDEIISKGVPVMREAVAAYKSVTVSPEFYEIERLRERSRHNEASAIGYAVDVAKEELTAGFLKRMKEANLPPDLIEQLLPN